MLLVVSRSDVRFGFDHPFFARPKSRAPKKKFEFRVRARVYVFSWLNKTINTGPEVQVSNGMLRKYFCVTYLYPQVIDNHSMDLQASNWAKEYQFNRAEPRELKDNS